ncbi:SMP-30/gluconolactonase/LRE family protein [Zavarzinella formosa]|uniref:SMP-30/gluconolactonase/LRE family protein n=1 Tax=Zavarzinella formosa TaxID=360055 RepID=UPI0002DEEF1D|nr:SMP-30/gluconolactonase/LRE family protein [Zavarzinella formosa]
MTFPLRAILALVVPLSLVASLWADDPIKGLGPVGPSKKLHTGFQFTEGPVADATGAVYFTDIPNERIHRIGLDDKLSIFREKSNHANGLKINGAGELVACEMDGQVAAYSIDGRNRRVIADKFNGKRFNAPNDLVADSAGGYYFTDPDYSAPKPLPQGVRTVYYVAVDGKVTRLIAKDLPNPNGITLSPDEKTLYVIPSLSTKMLAYALEGPGKLGESRIFCELKQDEAKKVTGGDGLTVDQKGNLYITTASGLQVFDPTGKLLGIISVPEQPANVTFGGKEFKTLYVAAKTSIYTIPMEVAGHRFSGKK